MRISDWSSDVCSSDLMINALTTDRVDMVLSGMTDTAERQASVTFVDYFTSGPQFYTLQKNKDTNEIIDLCGKKVGTSRRTTFPSEIAEWSKANCEAAGDRKRAGWGKSV